jgi:hypothetical protein
MDESHAHSNAEHSGGADPLNSKQSPSICLNDVYINVDAGGRGGTIAATGG